MSNVIRFPSERRERDNLSRIRSMAKLDEAMEAVPKPCYSTNFLYALMVFHYCMKTPRRYIRTLSEQGHKTRWNAKFKDDFLYLSIDGHLFRFGVERIPHDKLEKLKQLADVDMETNDKLFKQYLKARDEVWQRFQ